MRPIISLILATLCASNCYSQINKLNKHNKQTGKWIIYDANKVKSFEGRFRNGKPIRKAYYYIDGKLERIEKNKLRKIKTTLYYSKWKNKGEGQCKACGFR